mgnify:CR=1 FL=1|jgi:transcriptional regulator with XRE-family HTH domain
MTIGQRIKEERTRLKIKSKEFAEMVGYHPVTQSNYETGKRIPDLEYLEKLATAGVDITYIVTGQRGGVTLTDEEAEFLALIRKASPDVRATALDVLRKGMVITTKQVNIGNDNLGTINM